MIINRIYETQNLLSLWLVSFLVRLRTYQHPCSRTVLILIILMYAPCIFKIVYAMCVLLFLCYFHREIYVSVVCPGFLLSFWCMESIILSKCALVAVCIFCHVTFQYFAHSKCILYSSSLYFCFLRFKNFDFLLYSVSVCCYSGVPFCLLIPLGLMLKYFGVRCFVLHISF